MRSSGRFCGVVDRALCDLREGFDNFFGKEKK